MADTGGEVLKDKDPRRYRDLKKEGKLQEYLPETSERARLAYEQTVKAMLKANPGQWTWAFMGAEEIVIHDVLDPTT